MVHETKVLDKTELHSDDENFNIEFGEQQLRLQLLSSFFMIPSLSEQAAAFKWASELVKMFPRAFFVKKTYEQANAWKSVFSQFWT